MQVVYSWRYDPLELARMRGATAEDLPCSFNGAYRMDVNGGGPERGGRKGP